MDGWEEPREKEDKDIEECDSNSKLCIIHRSYLCSFSAHRVDA